MLHIQFFFCLSSLAVLASCLPAAEPADDPSACQSSWYAWYSSSEAWGLETSTVTLLSSTLTPAFDFEVPYTTLCDGVRRAATSRTTTQTVTYDPPFTATSYRRYPSPKPPCVPYIPCNTYCAIHESAVKVYYWPVTTTNGDYCAYNGSTIFAEPTSPPNADTVVTDGYTFTSPTNYISFSGLEGISRTRKYGSFTTCGGVSYDNVVVPVTGAMRTNGPDGRYSSLNFEGLNTIKYEDFKAQRSCRNNPCTAVEGFYRPDMALPTEVLDLQPEEWKAAGCGGTNYYRPLMVPLVTPAPVATGNLL